MKDIKEGMYAHIGSGTIDTESGWDQTFEDIYADPHAYGYRAEGEEECEDDGLEDLPSYMDFWGRLQFVEDEAEDDGLEDLPNEDLPSEEEFLAELKEIKFLS